MSQLIPMEYKNQRIMTTKVLAENFNTEDKIISNNFNRNTERFIEGKHYYKLEGAELAEFKTNHLNDEPSMLRVNCLYLWTERGAARHAKILETDEAWNVYEVLEDTYFRIVENGKQSNLPQNYKQALLALVAAEEEKEKLLLEGTMKDQIICELQPKATYYDLILQSKSAMPIGRIAKDYGMSAVKFNELLHELHVQYKQSDMWLLYIEHANMGYTSSKTHHYINSHYEQCSRLHTYWTQKGRLFIYDLLKNKKDILPVMEREKSA